MCDYIPTPGKNEKHYLAGALHAGTGRVDYVSAIHKKSGLFFNLLLKLRSTYRSAKTIMLIVDNDIIHNTKETLKWLQRNQEFIFIYQPVYPLWVNRLELLWLVLKETVIRNHSCGAMWQLLKSVDEFMKIASPFPGNKPSLSRSPISSAIMPYWKISLNLLFFWWIWYSPNLNESRCNNFRWTILIKTFKLRDMDCLCSPACLSQNKLRLKFAALWQHAEKQSFTYKRSRYFFKKTQWRGIY